ncbi:uncharacterized protein LOC120547597 [Perca fluviatilis]|uniref:uncharacterized protein LOC120547597 n=1 Tax=Perca fluviatilis TaxID=8168 RepID=UPI001964DD77|nr:uncharacterized protein LOC120547597 [Perca fluviatilis]
MGKSNSKPLTVTVKSELKGCAKIMCEKHGDETCKPLSFWVKTFGFPENGSFSVRLIQRLQDELDVYEKMNGYGSVDWKAFKMWKQEADEQQRRREKGRKKATGKTNPCPRLSHPQKDLNLVPASAAHQPVNPQWEVRGQPTPAEPTPPGPGSEDVLAGPVSEGRKSQTTPAINKIIEVPDLSEARAREIDGYDASTLDSEATRSPTTNGIEIIEDRDLREIGASVIEVYRARTQNSGTTRSLTTNGIEIIEERDLREIGASVMEVYRARTRDSGTTRSPTTNGIEIIEERDLREIGASVMEVYRARTQNSGIRRSQTINGIEIIEERDPRDIGAGAMEVYGATRSQKTHGIIQIVQVPDSYKVLTPDEISSIAKEMPNIDKRGGAAFVKILSQIVQQFKPSLREIYSLLIHSLKLKFCEVRGVWLERDGRYDWTPGAGYREHVEEICERIKTTFPAIERWEAIRWRQKPGETVEDHLIRLTKEFDDNSGLDPDTPLYGSLLKHYFLLGMDEQIKDQAFKHSPLWDMEPLSSIQAHAVHAEQTLRDLDDKKKQAEAQKEERLTKELIQALQALNGGRNGGQGPSRGSRRHGCWNCGDPSHWKRDCDQSG